ncbi:hypothetical protein TNCT_107241 [Trichonephila clavata]|uniref:Uncharacterized protein n=1 Tax=Trichonephila clavata TaxID=2740835 RepID=A0A8X6GIL5_TRICU|nr:hypothetical protein TNCT_107241 [Trichonephila clavata]
MRYEVILLQENLVNTINEHITFHQTKWGEEKSCSETILIQGECGKKYFQSLVRNCLHQVLQSNQQQQKIGVGKHIVVNIRAPTTRAADRTSNNSAPGHRSFFDNKKFIC